MFTYYNNQFARTTQNVFGMPARLVFDAPDMDHSGAYLESQKPQPAPTLTQSELDAQDPVTAEIREVAKQVIAAAKNGVPIVWDEISGERGCRISTEQDEEGNSIWREAKWGRSPEQKVEIVEINKTNLPNYVEVSSEGAFLIEHPDGLSFSKVLYVTPEISEGKFSINADGKLVFDFNNVEAGTSYSVEVADEAGHRCTYTVKTNSGSVLIDENSVTGEQID